MWLITELVLWKAALEQNYVSLTKICAGNLLCNNCSNLCEKLKMRTETAWKTGMLKIRGTEISTNVNARKMHHLYGL